MAGPDALALRKRSRRLIGTLLFRADASVAIGTGHVMRCLALAQAWQDLGGKAVFACAALPDALKARLQAESCSPVLLQTLTGSDDDAKQTADLAKRLGLHWIVVDGYEFSAGYQALLQENGFKILVIDDHGHAGTYSADIVLDVNLDARESMYRNCGADARLLLGHRYVLLRREFIEWRKWKREISQIATHLLVSMGGSDPDNLTLGCLDVLAGFTRLKVTVAVGGGNPHLARLRETAARYPETIVLKENAANMPELMANADLGLIAAGGTSYEAVFLGLPMLVVSAAPNQMPVAAELERRGIAINLGAGAKLAAQRLADELTNLIGSAQVRENLSRSGRALIDGGGAMRVARAIRWHGIRLREALESDARTLWELANDEAVRSASFSPQPIPWDQHEVWFRNKLADSNCRFLIAEDSSAVIGQVRLQMGADGQGEIGASLRADRRGGGLGSHLIERAAEKWLRNEIASGVHAYIRSENRSSQRAFENAGFTSCGECMVKGAAAVHYVRLADRTSASRKDE